MDLEIFRYWERSTMVRTSSNFDFIIISIYRREMNGLILSLFFGYCNIASNRTRQDCEGWKSTAIANRRA